MSGTAPSHVALLASPVARSAAGADAAAVVADLLRARGIRSTVVAGAGPVEATGQLRAALDRGADAVVVAGGDGTVHLALQVLAGTDVPLGIVPVGTGNDIAAAIGLPSRRIAAAAEAIGSGRIRTIDLARATRPDGTSRVFAAVLATGFDSRVNERANAMRWPRGRRRYDLSVLIEFALLRSIPFRLRVEHPDGRMRTSEEDALLVAVGNGRTYGGGIPICPGAELDDGLLDVTVVRPAGRLRLLSVLARAYRGAHVGMPQVHTIRTRRIEIDAPALTGFADGEPVGMLPLVVEAQPRALRVYVP